MRGFAAEQSEASGQHAACTGMAQEDAAAGHIQVLWGGASAVACA